MNKWDKPEYQRIAKASYRDGELRVRFEDESEIGVTAIRLLPPGTHTVNWDQLQVDPYEIAVPVNGRSFEIPWSTLRSVTDPAYGSHLARMAEDRSKLIGARLRELREARRLSAKDVAERAGISAQSLSRIENARHDVVFTTLQKILAAMGCTLKDLASMEDTDPEPAHNVYPTSLRELAKPMAAWGFTETFLTKRIVPRRPFASEVDKTNSTLERLTDLFACSKSEFLQGHINWQVGAVGAYKLPRKAAPLKTRAYALYAYRLCQWTLEAFDRRRRPVSAAEFIDLFRKHNEIPTFESLLYFVWEIGIPVLPLADSGAFHGACWIIRDRPVIVLKQNTQFHARWLFDLAHEIGHVLLHLTQGNAEVVEQQEISPVTDDDPMEESANDFAHNLLFRNQQEALIKAVVNRAKGNIPALKRAVVEIATIKKAPVDLLANYLAYRLSLQGESWWGTANNLQYTDPAPLDLARQVFIAGVKLSHLEPQKREVLFQALKDNDSVEEFDGSEA